MLEGPTQQPGESEAFPGLESIGKHQTRSSVTRVPESDPGGWLRLGAVSLDLELCGKAAWKELRSWFAGLTVGCWSLEEMQPRPETLPRAEG